MKPIDFTYRIFHNQVLYLEWPASIETYIINIINQLAIIIKNRAPEQITDIVPAYHTLTIYFKSAIDETLLADLLNELHYLKAEDQTKTRKLWKIPVVYGGKYGPDFDKISEAVRMQPEHFILKHSSPVYDVFFLGFLPGFPYLAGLDPDLHMPRKAIPTVSLQAGSVGIGGSQSGIYPVRSPGGWHIIGYTPFPIFELKRTPAIVIQSGDQIQFHSIRESEIESSKIQLMADIQNIYPGNRSWQN